MAMLMSCQAFNATPGVAAMLDTSLRAEHEGADIAKLALMPRAPAHELLGVFFRYDAFNLLI